MDGSTLAPASSREDVVNAYRLVLGRNPEAEAAIAGKWHLPPAELTEVLLRSEECRAVLERLAQGQPPPHLALAPEEMRAALLWAGAPHATGERGGGGAALVLALLDAALAVPGLVEEPLAANLAALREAGGLPSSARPYAPMPLGADVLTWSEDGVFLEGWMDDRVNPARALLLEDSVTGAVRELPLYRCRRADAEGHRGLAHPAELGLWTAAALPRPVSAEGLEFRMAHRHGEATSPFTPGQRLALGRQEFLDHVLGYLGRRGRLGNATGLAFAELDASLGATIAELHRRLAATRAVTVRGDFLDGSAAPPVLSLVCVLYGLPDFLYLLVSQFARFAPLGALEFVFVCNSPEIEDTLLRDAELAAFTFRTHVRVVGLNQNCGFSHANNIGIAAALADSILVINPDVFPRHAGAVRHLIARAEAGLGNSLVGGRLHYADGSVMHDGMVFEPDRRLAASGAWTVEHLRKGFPDRPEDAAPRPVPAVSGALMLFSRRSVADRLGGTGPFDEGFVYGHYEDADLCLRLSTAGGQVEMDPGLAFWHYEGKGSVRRPEHAGSGLYNRWLFSRRWGERLAASR